MKLLTCLLSATLVLTVSARADEAGLKKAADAKHAHDQAAAEQQKKLASDQQKAKEAAKKKKKDGSDATGAGSGGVPSLR